MSNNKYNFTQEEMLNANSRSYTYPIIYNDEEFRRISDYIPEIADYYFISNYGRIFSGKCNYILITHISNSGYEIINLAKKDYTIKPMSIHRLVAICFIPILNPELYVVNHKDGIKTHNWVWNLEWTTSSENMQHCYRNNLEINGENHPWATISEQTAHEICQLLEKGYSNNDVSIAIFGDKSRRGIVNSIRIGNSWINVSRNYSIPPSDVTAHFRRRFTDEQLKEMYKLAMSGLKNKDIGIAIGVDMDNLPEKERERIYRVIRSLVNGTAYKHISRKL